MVLYFKQIKTLLKHSTNNSMSYLKADLRPENLEHLVMKAKVCLPTLFQLWTCSPVLFEIPLGMYFKPTAF